MMKRYRGYSVVKVLVFAIVIASAIGVYFVFTDTPPLAAPPKDVAGRSTSAGKSMNVGSPKVETKKSVSVQPNDRLSADKRSLPPANAPLATILATLKEQAGAGNRAAACRLGFELDRCGVYFMMRDELGKKQAYFEQRKISDERSEAAKVAIDGFKKQMALEAGVCEGVDSKESLSAWQYTFNAAVAGDVPSILRFSKGGGLRLQMGPAENMEGWAAYKQNVIPLVERAIDQGSAEAAADMSNFYLAPRFGSQLVPKDPVKAVAYLLAVSNVGSLETRSSMERLIKSTEKKYMLTDADHAKAEEYSSSITQRLMRSSLAGQEVSGADALRDGNCARQ